MKKIVLILFVTFLGLTLSDASADKGGKGNGGKGFNQSSCMRTATKAKNTCRAVCQTAFGEDQKACKAQGLVEKECIEACFSARDACVETARVALMVCLETANAALVADLALCTQTDLAEKYACQNAARVKAFEARLACEAAFKLDPNGKAAVKKCQSDTKACLKICKNVNTPTPTATVAP